MEAEWKKREDQWKRESDARERLMREVHAERQLQLRLKAERGRCTSAVSDVAGVVWSNPGSCSLQETSWRQKNVCWPMQR